MSFKSVKISMNNKSIVQKVVTIQKGNDVQPQKLKTKRKNKIHVQFLCTVKFS